MSRPIKIKIRTLWQSVCYARDALDDMPTDANARYEAGVALSRELMRDHAIRDAIFGGAKVINPQVIPDFSMPWRDLLPTNNYLAEVGRSFDWETLKGADEDLDRWRKAALSRFRQAAAIEAAYQLHARQGSITKLEVLEQLAKCGLPLKGKAATDVFRHWYFVERVKIVDGTRGPKGG